MSHPVDLATIADALRAAEVELDAACGSSGLPEGDYLAASVDRSLRRAPHADLLPIQLRERVLADLVLQVRVLDERRRACGMPASPRAAASVDPGVPWCVRSKATFELRAALDLAAWGFDAAADALASATSRLARTRCAPPLQPGDEVVACSCGGEITPPNPVVHGLLDGFPIEFQDDIVAPGGCVVPNHAPDWTCPLDCAEARLAPERGRARARTARPDLVVSYAGPLTVVSSGGDAFAPETVDGFRREAASCVGGGAAEWVNGWVPWNPASSRDACIAHVASTHLHPSHWAAVEVRPR